MLQPVFYGTLVPLLAWATVKKLVLDPLEVIMMVLRMMMILCWRSGGGRRRGGSRRRVSGRR